METKGIVSLYVASKNDTIESICEKLKIERDILLRYNPLLKTVNLHENMPLTIVSFFKEQTLDDFRDENMSQKIESNKKDNDKNKDISDKVNMPVIPNRCEFNQILKSITFYLKEGIASNAFYKENIQPVSDELEKLYSDLTKFFKNLSNEEYRKKFIDFLKQYEKAYLEIIPILQKKDPELIKRYQENLDMISNDLISFLNEVESEINKPSVLEALKRLSELFQLFGLKIVTLRYKTAQTVFREILNQIDKLAGLITFEDEKKEITK